MPVECTASNLAEQAKCFCGLTPQQRDNVRLYLLAVIAGVEPDPDALAEAAKCFCGIGPKQQKQVQTYLLCQIANA